MSIAGTAGGRISAGVGANLIGQHAQDRNQDATIYVGNLDPQVCLLPSHTAVLVMSYVRSLECPCEQLPAAILGRKLQR